MEHEHMNIFNPPTDEEIESMTLSILTEIKSCKSASDLHMIKTYGVIKQYADEYLDEPHMDIIRKAFNEKCDTVVGAKSEKYAPTIHYIMTTYNLTRKDISNRFDIPYRTVQNWSLGIRNCPDYVINMIIKLLDNDL